LPLIVLITFAHSYSGVRAGWSLWDSGWDTYEVLKLVVSETMVKVAMPTFFVMSGYLFFVNVTEWNAKTYWSKLRRRVKKLLIPYIIWNIAMAVKLQTFSLSIFIEPANMPLWFLRDLMIVSLLTPIIYRSQKTGLLALCDTPTYISDGTICRSARPNPVCCLFLHAGGIPEYS